MNRYRTRKGIILVICMIFLCIFSAMAVCMATMSGTNIQIAENQHKANGARACAESGLEVIRYWLNQVVIPGTVAPDQRFNQIANSFQSIASAASGVTADYDGSNITVPSIFLDSVKGQGFSATIRPIDSETLQIDATGVYGPVIQTIRAKYRFTTQAHSVFDFGVATKGPLSLSGNIQLEGVNISVESDVYIESENSNLALSIVGNSQIAGNVSIANPIANVYLQGGKAGIGGETGQNAINNHVTFGVPPTDFPAPDPAYFRTLVALNTLNPATYASQTTFENIIIPPNTNPSFASGTTFNGIVFIETPNIVTFTGHANITGIIIGNGNLNDDSKTNQIIFRGTVDSHPVSQLPATPQFAPLRDKTGTFLMAPGFGTSFGGTFDTLNGAIAANGVEFFGNAGGTVNGSIINYSEQEMTFSGNSDLYFNRSGITQIPAGFVPQLVLKYDPNSYSEGPF